MLTILVAFVSLSASAYDFKENGFYYNVVSLSDMTCEVTSGDTKYTGDVEIPSIATYKGRTLSVTGIDDLTFNSSGITSLIIPNSITTIGDYAFSSCTNLKSVKFGNGLTNVELYNNNSYFYDSKNVTKIEVGNSIGMAIMFVHGLGNVETLIISEDYIEDNIPTLFRYERYYYFSSLSSLKTFICKKTVPPTLGTDISNSQYLDLEVYVPAESLATYQSTDVWKDFWELKAIDYTTGINTPKVGNAKTTDVIYDLQGRKLKASQKGMNIINGKKVLVK